MLSIFVSVFSSLLLRFFEKVYGGPFLGGFQKRWQNPIECLSLTLEEVTHIRSVLTKAELESLISHSDLYNQVAKSKVSCLREKREKMKGQQQYLEVKVRLRE